MEHLPAGMKEQFAAVRTEMAEQGVIIRSEMRHRPDDLKKTIHDGQTALLEAFYSFAESNQTRLTDLERNVNYHPPIQ